MISVAIAAYKGERYISEQIESILPQLGANDEIIVSDDKPNGATGRIVQKNGGARPTHCLCHWPISRHCYEFHQRHSSLPW
ncbi:MAG: hypothetical protein R3Y27_09205 [Clostridia bacterium]